MCSKMFFLRSNGKSVWSEQTKVRNLIQWWAHPEWLKLGGGTLQSFLWINKSVISFGRRRPFRRYFIESFKDQLEGKKERKVDRNQCDQKKSPDVSKSWLEKWQILTPLQNCLKCGQFGQINCCHKLLKLARSPINRRIWSHWKEWRKIEGIEGKVR